MDSRIEPSEFPSVRTSKFKRNFKKIRRTPENILNNRRSNINNMRSNINNLNVESVNNIDLTIEFCEDIFRENDIDKLVEYAFNKEFKEKSYSPDRRKLIKYYSYKIISPPGRSSLDLSNNNTGTSNFKQHTGVNAYLNYYFLLIKKLFRKSIINETNPETIQLVIKIIDDYIFKNTVTFEETAIGSGIAKFPIDPFEYRGRTIAPLLLEILIAKKINGVQTNLPNCGDVLHFDSINSATNKIPVQLLEVKSSLDASEFGLINKFLGVENTRVKTKIRDRYRGQFTPIEQTRKFIIDKNTGMYFQSLKIIKQPNNQDIFYFTIGIIKRRDYLMRIPLPNDFFKQEQSIEIEISQKSIYDIIKDATKILIDIGILTNSGRDQEEKKMFFLNKSNLLYEETIDFFNRRGRSTSSMNKHKLDNLKEFINTPFLIDLWKKLSNDETKGIDTSQIITQLSSLYGKTEGEINEIYKILKSKYQLQFPSQLQHSLPPFSDYINKGSIDGAIRNQVYQREQQIRNAQIKLSQNKKPKNDWIKLLSGNESNKSLLMRSLLKKYDLKEKQFNEIIEEIKKDQTILDKIENYISSIKKRNKEKNIRNYLIKKYPDLEENTLSEIVKKHIRSTFFFTQNLNRTVAKIKEDLSKRTERPNNTTNSNSKRKKV